MAGRPIFLNTVTVSHLVRAVVTLFLVTIVVSKRLVGSHAMAFAQFALVFSLFLPSIMAFLVTAAMLYPWFPLPAEVFLHHVGSDERIRIMSSLLSEVTPLHSVSFVLAVVKAVLLPSAVISVVVAVYLAMQRGASQQLLHLDG